MRIPRNRYWQRKMAKNSWLLNKKVEFALNFEMITDKELEEINKGNMVIEGAYLINLNNATIKNPTGTQVKLYPGRKIDVMVDSILDVETDKGG